MDAETLAVLREIRDDQRAILRLLEQQACTPQRRVSTSDRAVLARLLPAIWGVMMGKPFAVRDLATRSQSNVAPAVRLHDALAGIDAKKLGYLFKRCAGRDVDGYSIVKRGRGNSGVNWQVRSDDASLGIVTVFASALGGGSNAP